MVSNSMILIVDDEPEALELLEIDLSSWGYAVVKADSGDVAVQKAKAYIPDLIIIDVLMPDMNGGQVVRTLREDPRTQNIPVIFLTAALTKDDRTRGITVDHLFYPALPKPFDINELMFAIETHLYRTKKV